jgi:hypothetical protein
MSNPNVTATISVDDKASPALKELARLAKMIGEETAKALKGGGDGLTQSLNKANVAATAHISKLTAMRNLYKEIGGIAAGIAGGKVFSSAKQMIGNYLPLEKANRYNNAIIGATPAEQKALFDQQIRGAKVYGTSMLETSKGQGVFAARNYNAATVAAATDVALKAAKAQGVDTATAAKMLETGTFTRGIDFKDPASATRELMNTADREAVAAKRAAMQPEDIQMLAKFGFGTATAAGASQSTMWAIGMALNRAGVGGDQSGVFERSIFGKGLAGGPKADSVYASLGIDKGMFYKKGDASPEALAKAIDTSASNTFGVRLSADAQKRLREKMADPDSEVLSTKANLVQAVISAIQESSGKDLNKNEQKEVAKSAGGQYELARGGFNGDAWFNYMLHHLSPAQAVAMFGTQQAGRFEMLQNGKFKYQEYRDQQDHADGFNDKIAAERMEGLGAAVDRLKESLDAVSNDMVKANENWLVPLTDAAGKVVGVFTGLSDGMKETLSVSALAAAGSGITAIGRVALTAVGSINSLAVSAERASLALSGVGGAGVAGGAAAATKAGLGGRALSAVGGVASFLGGWGLAGATVMVVGEQAIKAIPDGTGGAFKHGTGRGVNNGRPPLPPDPFWAQQPGWESHWYQSPFLTNRGTLAKEGADLRGLPDLPSTKTTWHDSVFAGEPGKAADGDAKWGSGKVSSAVEVTGSITGSAELHNNMTITIQASQYFESLVKRAENVANMTVSGRLGTSMQGPGDNGTKPSQSALVGTQ